MKTDDQSFDDIVDAVHDAETKAFHLDDAEYVEHEKEVFDKLAEGVVGYEHPETDE